jgi:hypothetical protein
MIVGVQARESKRSAPAWARHHHSSINRRLFNTGAGRKSIRNGFLRQIFLSVGIINPLAYKLTGFPAADFELHPHLTLTQERRV